MKSNLNRMNFKTILAHALFWLIYYGIEFFIEFSANIFSKSSIPRYFLGISLFYFLLNILRKKGLVLQINLLIYSFLIFTLASLCLKYGTFNLTQNFINPPISIQILYVVDNFVHLFFIAFILISFEKMIEKYKQGIASENQLYEIETDYLNSKIDAHFFMNSINLFYVHFLKNKLKAAPKLIKLTDFVKKHL